jgi:hypothetical protein
VDAAGPPGQVHSPGNAVPVAKRQALRVMLWFIR